MRLKIQSITSKLAFTVTLSIVLVVTIVVIYNAQVVHKKTIQATQNIALKYADDYSVEFQHHLNKALQIAEITAATFSTVPLTQSTTISRGQAEAMLEQILLKNPEILGIYLSWEPNAFDGKDTLYIGKPRHDASGRFIPYLVRSADGAILKTRTQYYNTDSELGNWYNIPKQTHKTYVNEPTSYLAGDRKVEMVSFVAPIMYNSKFYGVAGVDIAVESFQMMVEDFNAMQGQSHLFVLAHNGDYVASSQNMLLLGSKIQKKQEDIDDMFRLAEYKSNSFSVKNDTINVYAPVYIGNTGLMWLVGIETPENVVTRSLTKNVWFSVLISLLFIFPIVFLNMFFINRLLRPLQAITRKAEQMAKGDLEYERITTANDEIGQVNNAINILLDGLRKTSEFANEIGKGNLKASFVPLSKKDVLGNSLLMMRENLKKAEEIEEQQKKENELRSWITSGLAKFGDILRQNADNINELAYNIISNLIDYIEAIQGGIFIYNDDKKDEPYLELLASYAYDRRKYHKKKVLIGEGLAGTCALEKQLIHLTEIPADYMEITSGLGKAPPKSLLVVPLKTDEGLHGVLEIATLTTFEKYQIDFIEEIADDIASTLSAVKISEQTHALLRESQQQREAMASQEEEMRQNLEELQTTQEEAARKEFQMQGLVQALNSSTYTMEYDLNGEIQNVNEPFAQLYGKPKNEIIGLNHRDGIDKAKWTSESYRQFWDDLRNGMHKQEINRFQFNNRTVWLSESYTPLFDEKGDVYKVLKIAFDITETKSQAVQLEEQKQELLSNEEELRQNLEELKTIQEELEFKQSEFETMIEAMDKSIIAAEYHANGEILRVNDNFLTISGYERGELVGKNMRELFNDEEYEIIWQNVLKGETYSGEQQRQNKAGENLWIFVNYTPAFDDDGRVYKVFFFGQEITQTKRLQIEADEKAQALRFSEEQLNENYEELQKIELKLRKKIDMLKNIEAQHNEHKAKFDAIQLILNEIALVLEIDTKGRILYCNSLFKTRINDNCLNQSLNELIKEAEASEQLKRKLAMPTQQVITFRCHLGDVAVFAVLTAIVQNNEITGYLLIGLDVSDNKFSEPFQPI